MVRKIIIFCIALCMLIAVGFVNQEDKTVGTIYQQHKIAQKEDESVTGLSKDGTLSTHMPIIIIKTNGREIPGVTRSDENKLLCDYEIIDNKSSMNVSTQESSQKGKMLISIRGNSSRALPKKQYAVKLVNSNGKSKAKSILDLPEESDFILSGNYIDKSLIRNYMIYNISQQIMQTAPKVRFCEVMITDSNGNTHYEGVYNLIEKIKVSPMRTNLNKYNPKYKETSFMLQMNTNISDHLIKHITVNDALINNYNLEYPGKKSVTDQSLDYVQNEVYILEKKIFDAANTGNWKEVRQAIDYKSFAQFFVINEFFQNYDAGKNSTYMYRNLGKKYVAGPVWDFDGAMNNFGHWDIDISELRITKKFYYHYLFKDKKFSYMCVKEYKDLRKTYLSDEYLLNYICETSDYLGSSALRNCDRWYNSEYETYYNDIEKLKTYVKERGEWMDKHFATYSTVIGVKEAA